MLSGTETLALIYLYFWNTSNENKTKKGLLMANGLFIRIQPRNVPRLTRTHRKWLKMIISGFIFSTRLFSFTPCTVPNFLTNTTHTFYDTHVLKLSDLQRVGIFLSHNRCNKLRFAPSLTSPLKFKEPQCCLLFFHFLFPKVMVFVVCFPRIDSAVLCPLPQLRLHRDGSAGPAVDGLPLPEHQLVCGELPQDGPQAAGVRQTQSADSGNQFGQSLFGHFSK